MAEQIPSTVFNEWMAFFSLEPFGNETENWRTGVVASTIANVNRNPKRKPDPYKPKDFMPKRRKRMSGDEIKAVMRGIANGNTARPSIKT